MKRSVGLWQLMGFAVATLGGTLLHFLYDLLGGARWVAPFSGVNESTFEHMKLLFWPMLAYAVFESFFFREREDFFCIKLRGILLGLALIPVIFYTYNGVIGKSPDWVNIAIFFVTAAIVYIYESSLFKRGLPCRQPRLPILVLSLIGVLLVVFTFLPPEIDLFKDPLTNSYGIPS